MRYWVAIAIFLLVSPVFAQSDCELTGPTVSATVATTDPTGAANSITETSGLVVSSFDDDLLFSNDDNGEESWIYAIGRQTGNVIAAFDLDVPEAGRDIEDIAMGPGPVAGEPYIYLGDIGGNGQMCGNGSPCRVWYIWRVLEQALRDAYFTATGETLAGDRPDDEGGTIAITGTLVQRAKLKNPPDLVSTGPETAYNQDCESMMVDPLSDGDLYFINKGSGYLLTAADADITWGRAGGDPELTMTYLGDVNKAAGTITGADITRDGNCIGTVYANAGAPNTSRFYTRDSGTIASALIGSADYCEDDAVLSAPQNESIAFLSSGSDVIATISEGTGQQIRNYASTSVCKTRGDCSAETGTSTTWEVVSSTATSARFKYTFYAAGISGQTETTRSGVFPAGTDLVALGNERCEGIDAGRTEDEQFAAIQAIAGAVDPQLIQPAYPEACATIYPVPLNVAPGSVATDFCRLAEFHQRLIRDVWPQPPISTEFSGVFTHFYGVFDWLQSNNQQGGAAFNNIEIQEWLGITVSQWTQQVSPRMNNLDAIASGLSQDPQWQGELD